MAELDDKHIRTLKKLIETAETNLAGARELLASLVGDEDTGIMAPRAAGDAIGKVIEGAFNGQAMIDETGKSWSVPANYASKSKLVQGDELKLTVTDNGSFLYKQIGPVPRRKIIGTLNMKDGQFFVEAQGVDFRVLLASVTYYKAQPGDQVTIVVPEEGDAEWAAIEAVIR